MKKKKSQQPAKKKIPPRRKATTTASKKKKPATIKSKIKLTRQQEAAARTAHDLYWKSYIKGDIKTLASLLGDHYTQIGSVENEVFFNKKDAVKFVETTIDQVAGNVEMRNRVTKAEKVDGFVLLHEQCDLYVLIEGVWTFYSKFRASSLMQNTGTGWKMIHQHSSLPDSKAQEGENIAVEKVAAENLQLRDAVKRRTVELEQKNRELAIEAAMEKVRVHSLAMQKPEELADVAEVLRNEMGALGVEELETSSIYIFDENKGSTECWFAIKDIRAKGKKLVTDHMTLRLHETWVGKQMQKFYRSKQTHASIIMKGENRKEWINYCAGKSSVLKGYYGAEIPERTYHLLKFSNGFMGAASPGAISNESWDLLQRATAVFSFAYKRFSDLQKAEAQAREAQIEAALERVRSRSMAMHKSEELREVLQLIFEQLRQLNFNIDSAQFNLNYKESDDLNVWTAVPGQPYPTQQFIPYFKNPILDSVKQAKENGLTFFSHVTTFEEKNEFFQHFFNHVGSVPEERKKYILERPGYARSVVFLDNLFLGIQNYAGIPYSDTENAVLRRFGKVFEQSYTRFLDLQKAEAQAREAKIEAALEKVRGKAMAMHNSNDLLATAGAVFTELRKLGIKPIRCGVGLLTNDSKIATLYHSISTEKGDEFLYAGTAPLEGHPVIAEIYDSASRGEPCFPVLKGELLRTYYEKVLSGTKIPDERSDYVEYGYFLSFTEGFFYGWSIKPITETDIKILNRFKLIIDLTFRRYIELQKAETNAIEAVRRSSLDRVRAEIASMRTTGDLERITPLIWNELTILGVPFIRCGVFVMDEQQQQIHSFLSTPDGKAIASFNTPFSNPGTLTEAVPYWRKKEIYKAHWDEAAFVEQAKSLVEQGAISSPEKYLTENRPAGLYLHFLPFLQGMLYVGNIEPLSDEQLQLVQTLADAFSTAYARYEDFNKLESAKIQIEKTLVDLRQTQAQLVQSEKMASLGELTAGIAHEIQNPLNFVNNFSEVSTELVDEMNGELQNGNTEDAKQIAADLKQNLIKISHHGKRAGEIVKGMLQHSRSSSGVKEPTDINTLADEYLRLAYHGLRAKDKSFNATLITDYDQTIGNINVVPQDIGRVILNLITNAFYVVNEKKNSGLENYEPTVSVSTKKIDDKVLISVKDNGNGIPQKVLDKIFQPFFTTKPTGQGTGLGLSLSYDIVKAHGGELQVETREGEGTPAGKAGSVFTIALPIT